MVINTKYAMYSKIKLDDIDVTGTITQIKLDGLNIMYLIEYWMNGELKSVWIFEQLL